MGTQLFQSKDEALEKLKSDNPTDRRRAIEYLKEFINALPWKIAHNDEKYLAKHV